MVRIRAKVREILTAALALAVAGACSRQAPAVDAGVDRPLVPVAAAHDAAADQARDAQPDLRSDVAGPPPRPRAHHAAAPRPEPAGGFNVEGGIGRADAEAVLRGARAKLQACYEKARAQTPDLKGRVVFRLSVDGRGRVPLVEAVTSTLGGGDPELCMVEALRNLKFPPAASGAESTLTFPMSFGR
ncbi:MAG TPA: AgmX/PglI C-terminal domain-containing protein [Polyangia bacterium]|nr:AgmX/PglI C-terminal domain-containing protein [Polyangia bacterium]